MENIRKNLEKLNLSCCSSTQAFDPLKQRVKKEKRNVNTKPYKDLMHKNLTEEELQKKGLTVDQLSAFCNTVGQIKERYREDSETAKSKYEAFCAERLEPARQQFEESQKKSEASLNKASEKMEEKNKYGKGVQENEKNSYEALNRCKNLVDELNKVNCDTKKTLNKQNATFKKLQALLDKWDTQGSERLLAKLSQHHSNLESAISTSSQYSNETYQNRVKEAFQQVSERLNEYAAATSDNSRAPLNDALNAQIEAKRDQRETKDLQQSFEKLEKRAKDLKDKQEKEQANHDKWNKRLEHAQENRDFWGRWNPPSISAQDAGGGNRGGSGSPRDGDVVK
jgi:hypothetical protein